MSLYLNLGCGRVVFPLDEACPPEYMHHLQPLDPACFGPGWVNVDKYAMPGIQEQIDLFRFPWVKSSDGRTWDDNSVDMIWAAHIVEHVPHHCRPAAGLPPEFAEAYTRLTDEMDGFFLFFAEAWRILKPGGLIHVRAPFGICIASLSDPTHTRYLTPGTFGYLGGQDDVAAAPFDYHLPMRFQFVSTPIYRWRGKWGARAEASQLTYDDLMEILWDEPGAVDEFRLTLQALKPEAEPMSPSGD